MSLSAPADSIGLKELDVLNDLLDFGPRTQTGNCTAEWSLGFGL